MGKIKVIALIGEAGSGKDFLLRCVLSNFPTTFNEIISCTTRPMRMGEVDGKNYYFLTDERFQQLIKEDQMLETAEFNGWYYGTMKQALSEEKVNIGVFNPTGIRSLLKREDIELKVFYVRAPAKKRLIRQLNREDNPNVDEVIRRYTTDKEDFSKIDFEYYELTNETQEDLDNNVQEILSLISPWRA